MRIRGSQPPRGRLRSARCRRVDDKQLKASSKTPEVLACPLTLPVRQAGNNESPDSPNRMLSSAEWPPPMWSKASSRRAAAAEGVQ